MIMGNFLYTTIKSVGKAGADFSIGYAIQFFSEVCYLIIILLKEYYKQEKLKKEEEKER